MDTISAPVVIEFKDSLSLSQCCNSWQLGDLLLVDNMRLAHVRNPFGGERKVIVAMMDPIVRKSTEE